jgi:hypothetical protein
VPTFTPPTEQTVPALEADSRGLQARLFRFYVAGTRGRNVFKMPDGSYTEAQPQQLSNPDPINTASNAVTPAVTYYGGHSYTVTTVEAAALTAAGYGAYIS